MKPSKIATTLLGAALLFGTAVLAGEANKATLNIAETISVQGKTIAPGTYKVAWDGSGTTVQVTLTQGKHTVASFPAQASEQPAKNAVSAYGSATEADGSRALTAIYIGGKNTVLQLASAAARQQSANQNAK